MLKAQNAFSIIMTLLCKYAAGDNLNSAKRDVIQPLAAGVK